VLRSKPDEEDALIRLSAQQGRPVPSKIANQPVLTEVDELFWLAFTHLATERIPDGAIPWLSIVRWAEYYGLDDEDAEDLIEVVRAMDSAYIGHQNEKRATRAGKEKLGG
jgi:hypothetical protein